MEPKSCALIAGSRAAGLLEKGEKSAACLRFKMALAVQLAQLIDAGICHFFSCMQPGAEQWAAAMVLEFARSRPDISLTVMATPELERSLPARVERQAEILHKKSRRACLAWMAMNADTVLVLAGGGEEERRELPVWLQPKTVCLEVAEFGL